jgi:hypothetical protein
MDILRFWSISFDRPLIVDVFLWMKYSNTNLYTFLDLTRGSCKKCNYSMGPTQAFSQDPKRGRPILVQRYIYSKERGWGSRKCSSGKPLKFTLLHVSICSKLVRNFSNTLGFVILCRYAPLLNYDIFIQPDTPSN